MREPIREKMAPIGEVRLGTDAEIVATAERFNLDPEKLLAACHRPAAAAPLRVRLALRLLTPLLRRLDQWHDALWRCDWDWRHGRHA